MTSDAFDRALALGRLGEEEFDVLVVGGGITGAGVALDAASRGLRTALVERADFASGTSSQSSKLVHGGLRYLQQKEYRLVRENLAERRHLLANAPHLVHPLRFVLPLFAARRTTTEAVARGYAAALWAYDLSGGLHLGRHRRLTPAEVQEALPAVRAGAVAGGFSYADGFADDARLTLAVVRTAVLDHGAVAANYAPLAGIVEDASGEVRGAVLGDGTEVRARAVVNAAGVWADEVATLAGRRAMVGLRPAKGVHLTVERARLPLRAAAVLPAPDRRSIFVVPWGDRVYLGTTDTPHTGPLDRAACTPDDVAYVLDAANAALAEPLRRTDIVGTWAGLRPLVAGARSSRTADLSRRHHVAAAGNVVTVTGGKLTTYRRMAADAVDQVVALLGRGAARSPTRSLRLHGAVGEVDEHGEHGAHLAGRYGGETRLVLDLVHAHPALGRPLVAGLPYLRAEVVHAARHEMATTLDDVLSRRTRARILARDASAAAAPDAARLLGSELGWSDERVEQEAAGYRAAVAGERAAAGLGPAPARR